MALPSCTRPPPHVPARRNGGFGDPVGWWSSGQQVTDLFDRFAVAESLAGAVVQFGGDRIQIGLRVHGEVSALREVLAQ